MKSILFGCVLAVSSMGCAVANGEGDGQEPQVSAMSLQLTTEAATGNRYRLGPASFTIRSRWNTDNVTTVDVTGAEPSLRVPVASDEYDVTLEPGWTLNWIAANGELVPELATVLSDVVTVSVSEFETERVMFPFHLGQTGLAIGISVEEGMFPPGYDGRIIDLIDGSGNHYYRVDLEDGGGACCYDSAEHARASYPNLNLIGP